jgi:ABC-type multidrug transport system fused ATPase/permease subunit
MEEKDTIKKKIKFFSIVKKSMSFAVKTQPTRFIFLIILSGLLGGLVYVQFTSFSAVVDEIIKIKNSGINTVTPNLIRQVIILGTSFLLPAILDTVYMYGRQKFRARQITSIVLHRIEKQASLDIATVESSWYQNKLQQANQWGMDSIVNLQIFAFTSMRNIVGLFASVGILFSIDYRLVILAVIAAVPVYFYYRRYSMEVFRVRNFSTEDRRYINNNLNHFSNTERLIDVILLKLKHFFKDEVARRMVAFDDKVLVAEKRKSKADIVVSIWYVICFFLSIALITSRALNGTLAIGAVLLAFNSYRGFYQIVNSFFEMISVNEEAARYAGQWFELFELVPQVQNKADAQKIAFSAPPTIEFKNLSYSYKNEKESKQVLNNINLIINPGEKVAIVGMNGAGKTTLIKLLCRVYDADEGEILINGINIKDIDIDSWHECLGILFQDYPSYNVSVREAIAVGRKGQSLDEEKVLRAAELSGASDFIEEFPKKYEQLIWKGFQDGVDLSKGQHQRLAVARMFYRDALITVLDEPTASIDAVTEEKIFNSLEQHMQGKTVVLITHKFSTVKNADRIIVLEHGQIVESGRHDELMKKNGRYEELYNIQAKRYKDEVTI